jgi:hypothetical protein
MRATCLVFKQRQANNLHQHAKQMFPLLVSAGLVYATLKTMSKSRKAQWIVFSRDDTGKTWVLLKRRYTGIDRQNDNAWSVWNMPGHLNRLFSGQGFSAWMRYVSASLRSSNATIKYFCTPGLNSKHLHEAVAKGIQKKESIWVLYEIPMHRLLRLKDEYSANSAGDEYAVCEYSTLTHARISNEEVDDLAYSLFENVYDAYRALRPYGRNPPYKEGRVQTRPVVIYMIGKLLGLQPPPPVAPLLAYEVGDENSRREGIDKTENLYTVARLLHLPG